MKVTRNWEEIHFNEIVSVYESVNWTNYTKDIDSLLKAFKNSSLVLLAIENDRVIGVLRSISDTVSIHYLQDILVLPEFQKSGVGRSLLKECLEIYKDVRTHMLLTDDEEKQKKFYESLGYKNTKDLKKFNLNSFVKMKDISLV